MIDRNFKVALFDLDGVVFDTEPQYTIFWGGQCRKYYPNKPGLEQQIKGQTLVQIFDHYFPNEAVQTLITAELDNFERNMNFVYVPGFEQFIADLRKNGVKTAVVTSSNKAKMENVYLKHPEFKEYFDVILTSEDFAESKPSPDCYLKAAEKFGAQQTDCVVFEDSFNGLLSGRAAQMYVVGLSTTNSAEAIGDYSDTIIANYDCVDYEKMCRIITE